MKTRVRIYKPVKNAMQSGRGGKQQHWILEGLALTPRTPEHLMGWISAEDTNDQIYLRFESRDAAIAFAEEKGWTFDVEAPHKRKVKPRNYLDNFKYRPVEYEAAATTAPDKKKTVKKPKSTKVSSVSKSDTKSKKKG